MTMTERNGLKILTPAEGKYLTNGETYSQTVYLGKFDSADSWTEVDEIPEETEQTPEEQIKALKSELEEVKTVNEIILNGNDETILLGGETNG